MSNEVVLLKTYFSSSKSENNFIELYEDRINVVFKSQIDSIPLDQVKSISLDSKKLIVPLVIGGIGASFSMLAFSVGWEHYQINLGAVFFFLGLMYWGIIGRKALEINVDKHRHIYLLKEDVPQISGFLSFLNEYRFNNLKRGMERIFHIAYFSDWKIGEQNITYSHPSLLEDGFIHCSRIENIRKSYEIYFEMGVDVLLLDISVANLIPEVVYVDVPSRDTNFPHIHGPINKSSITKIYRFNSMETLGQVLDMYLYPSYS